MSQSFVLGGVGKQGGRARREPPQLVHGVTDYVLLLERIRAADRSLTPVLLTDAETFTGVPVPIYWVHGRDAYQFDHEQDRNCLWIEVPLEACRRIQSRYANWAMGRWFGQWNKVQLATALVRPNYIPPMEVQLHQRLGSGSWEIQEVADWPQLLQAIEAMASKPPSVLDRERIQLYEGQGASVNVVDDRLEIYIQNAVPDIEQAWIDTFREQALRAD